MLFKKLPITLEKLLTSIIEYPFNTCFAFPIESFLLFLGRYFINVFQYEVRRKIVGQ